MIGDHFHNYIQQRLEHIMSKKVLITGATGYLGSRLSKYFATQSDILPIVAGRKNLEFNFPHKFKYLDVLDKNSIEQSLEGVDYIIHLAALNFQDCQNNPERAKRVNETGTKNIVEMAKISNIKKIIYFSSIHVYGTPLQGQLNEDNPINTLKTNYYAATHYNAEKIIENAGIEHVIVRLSNAMGAPVHRDVNAWMLICNDLCKQAIFEKKLSLKSSGIQKRNFITISTLEQIVDHFINHDLPHQIYNIGGTDFTIYEMAELISLEASSFLNQNCPVLFPEPTKQEIDSNIQFDFCLKRLNALNLKLKNDFQNEIVNTLRFVKESISGK
jgi:UDP-glucose 4-epimerase